MTLPRRGLMLTVSHKRWQNFQTEQNTLAEPAPFPINTLGWFPGLKLPGMRIRLAFIQFLGWEYVQPSCATKNVHGFTVSGFIKPKDNCTFVSTKYTTLYTLSLSQADKCYVRLLIDIYYKSTPLIHTRVKQTGILWLKHKINQTA